MTSNLDKKVKEEIKKRKEQRFQNLYGVEFKHWTDKTAEYYQENGYKEHFWEHKNLFLGYAVYVLKQLPPRKFVLAIPFTSGTAIVHVKNPNLEEANND